MYTIVIFAIIGLIIGISIRECQILLVVLGGLVGLLIALFVGMGITYDMETYKETYEIVI